MSPAPLLGREPEVAEIGAFVAVGLERGAALLIIGEPGIGKSTLLTAARDVARDAGYTVLDTAGIESEMHLPFGGLHKALAPLMRHLPTLPEAQRHALATALGLSEGSNPDLFLIAEAAFTLLVLERRERPVLVVVDDVHWLDPQSHQIVTFLAHRSVDAGINVLGAIRSDHGGPFLDAGFPQMQVHGVDDDTAEALLGVHTGALSSAHRKRIRDEAQGNPLALLELPRSWGAGPATDDHPLAVSERLERAFAGRIAELPSGTRDALLVSAVCSSSDIDEIFTALVAFGTQGAPRELLGPAVAAGLLSDKPAEVGFRHPLVRSAVLQIETLTRRHAAHAALAKVLPADAYRRTWHRAWSIVGPDDDVADALAATVPDSLRRGAVMSAASSLERAAQLSTSSVVRGRRLVDAAGHAFVAGRPDVVARLLREASQVDLADLDEIRTIWLTETLNDDISANPALVRQLCDCAARAVALGDVGLALDLLFAAGLRCWWADNGADCQSELVRILDGLADTRDDPRHIAALAIAEPVLRGSDVLTSLDSVALDDVSDGDSLRVFGMAAYCVGDFVRATDLLDRAEASFRGAGRLGMLPVVLALQLQIRLDLGDWSGAVLASQEVVTISRETGQSVFAENNVLVEARGMALRGEWRAALLAMADSEAEAARLRINDRICFGYQAHGAALLSANRAAEAFACLKRQYDPADPGYHLRESFAGVALMAEAAVECGQHAEARVITRTLETVRVITPSPVLEVNLLYATAVLAPEDTQDQLFESALARDLTRWPWPRARLQLAYGQRLARLGRHSEAVNQLRVAYAAFDRMGAARWRESAASLLRHLEGDSGGDAAWSPKR